ncbi:MAG: UPF0262 family protein [Alphaproteobacteria bacterium]
MCPDGCTSSAAPQPVKNLNISGNKDSAAVPSANLKIIKLNFDEGCETSPTPEMGHERMVAVYDLLEDNYFAPHHFPEGPYSLTLGVKDNRLILTLANQAGEILGILGLSLSPFRRIIRDYHMVCDSYYAAVSRGCSLTQIEAVDMGRRGLHNEGAAMLQERLKGKVDINIDTARRLFTLLYVMQAGLPAMS